MSPLQEIMGMSPMGTAGFGSSHFGSEPAGQRLQAESSSSGDSLETYFQCITTCSLDDGACVTRCVEELREQH